MHRLRFKLVLSVLAITMLVMAGLGFVTGHIYGDHYENNMKDRLEKEAHLASDLVAKDGIDPIISQRQAEIISDRLDARVTIIELDGTVVGESSTDPTLMENHLDRPEIQELINGKDGSNVRYSSTVEDELLYYAVAVKQDTETIGYFRLGLSTDRMSEMTYSIWMIISSCFALAFVIIVFITYRLANQMIEPIENATSVAIELAEGNFKARTFEGNQDEIGQLSKSINVLAYNLEQLTRRHQAQKERMETLIENMGSGLILINTRGDISLINRTCQLIFEENTELWVNQLYHDVIRHKELIKIIQNVFITEKRQRKQISFPVLLEIRHFDVYGAPVVSDSGKLKGIALVLHDITELKKLEQVRKDFVANVSHELKTPVTSIKGFTETLLDGAMHTEELRGKFLGIIYKESERLQGLIHDLLELSRIEQQYFKLNWQQTNIKVIIEDVVVLLRGKAHEKTIDLELITSGDCSIKGDPERIKQIAINLINNGITYTQAGGKILVTLDGDSDENVMLQVRDTGIGISESELPRIFERFYRVDRARSRNSGGTGLGLAIVKHLVEAHHGRISVESEPGKGTAFSIFFKRSFEE